MFKKDLRADVLVGSFFVWIVVVADGWRNGLEQVMCLKPVNFDEFECFQRVLKRILD